MNQVEPARVAEHSNTGTFNPELEATIRAAWQSPFYRAHWSRHLGVAQLSELLAAIETNGLLYVFAPAGEAGLVDPRLRNPPDSMIGPSAGAAVAAARRLRARGLTGPLVAVCACAMSDYFEVLERTP